MENDYDGDISALESPQKVNKVQQNSNSATATIESSKLMQLYNRRKRQQESQLRSEFNVKHLDMKDLTPAKDMQAGKLDFFSGLVYKNRR